LESTSTEKVFEFWEWFGKNELKIYNALNSYSDNQKGRQQPHNPPSLEAMSKRLKRINPNLTYEFFPKSDEDGRFIFYVSAGGMKEAFPVVVNMIRFAPNSALFKFIPFKSAHPNPEELSNMAIGYGKDKLYVKDIYYKGYLNNSRQLNLDIFIKNHDDSQHENFEMIFVVLDKLIGEYDVTMLINGIEINKLTSKSGLKRITKLPEELDKIKALQDWLTPADMVKNIEDYKKS